MVDCLTRVEGLYVANNVLNIAVHCDLLKCTKQSRAFFYFLPWFNHSPCILKIDYQESVIDLSTLRTSLETSFQTSENSELLGSLDKS